MASPRRPGTSWHSLGAALHGVECNWETLTFQLGCGLGLAGVAAALTELPSRVLLTDVDPAAVRLAQLSARLSGVSGVVDAQIKDWNSREQWAPFENAFDVAIAADCIYSETLCAPLTSVLLRVLRPGGRFLLADGEQRPNRPRLHDLLIQGGRFALRAPMTRAIHVGSDFGMPETDAPSRHGRVVLQVYEKVA